jgi:hypothetical protein
VPFVPRAAVVVLVCSLAAPALIAGCGRQSDESGFCATIETGHTAFDATDAAHSSAALAEFDRVAATAPASLAPDLKTVAATLSVLYRDPASLANKPALLQRYVAAIERVDRYLHQTCGVAVPPAGKFL